MNETVEDLVEVERECIARFRSKAAKLAASNPGVSAQVLFARAVEQMPKTLEGYQAARQRLQFMGIAALPLR
jgi:hypothetical protein